MPNVNIDLSYSGIEEKEILAYEKQVKEIYENLSEKAKDENEFVGWLKLPSNYDKKEFRTKFNKSFKIHINRIIKMLSTYK